MGIKRYELSEEQWTRIAPLLPRKTSDPGRTALDSRLFVNGCLWGLRSGAYWCDLPERYGRWKTVHRRFSRWCHAGIWDECSARSRPIETTTTSCSTAPSSAPTSRQRPEKGAKNQALGHSRGGLTTKIHMLADTLGRPLRFRITAGQAHDITAAADLLEGQKAEAVLADKAYDSNELRELFVGMKAGAVTLSKRNRKVFIPHEEAYKHRNQIERCFGRLKHFRRSATRYDRRTIHFAGIVHLAATMIWLR